MTQEELLEIILPRLWSPHHATDVIDAVQKYTKSCKASKPVSGELLFNAKCCANCKHFIDKWPYKSECNFHGSKANITHAEEQCCDNWEN